MIRVFSMLLFCIRWVDRIKKVMFKITLKKISFLVFAIGILLFCMIKLRQFEIYRRNYHKISKIYRLRLKCAIQDDGKNYKC